VTNADGSQVQTDFVLDGTNVVVDLVKTRVNSGAAWSATSAATYLMGASGPMYRRPANAADVRWYAYDGGGNVVGEIDPAGNVTAGKKHDVFGVSRGGSGTAASKHGWQGGVGHVSEGETGGLVYMRARYYDPGIGRFQSEDPARDGVNWFVYCGNDSVNKIDSDGEVYNGLTEAFLGLMVEYLMSRYGIGIAGGELLARFYYVLKLVQFFVEALDTLRDLDTAVSLATSRGATHAILTLMVLRYTQRRIVVLFAAIAAYQIYLLVDYIVDNKSEFS
jgi:RHS repeat-associated protein